jgi:hypothetical protein
MNDECRSLIRQLTDGVGSQINPSNTDDTDCTD